MAEGMEKQVADEIRYTCCICGKKAEGFGNNPQPIKDKGRCCDACNAEVVIPARLGIMIKNKKAGAR